MSSGAANIDGSFFIAAGGSAGGGAGSGAGGSTTGTRTDDEGGRTAAAGVGMAIGVSSIALSGS